MWVDKYKPKSTSDILGQSRNVAFIKRWLKTFDTRNSKPIFIYGPPGIGKTTAAHLCCQETGYQVVEFNASDQRNKNVIKDVISTVCGTSRLNFFGRASETKDAVILDEIDGMAGNEDRGGIGQLMLELKHTKKPMIFICNDGQSQKLRSLKEKCEVLEFKRPDYDTIKALVNKIARDEHLRTEKIDIKNLAESSDFDIRQILNSLYLFESGQPHMSKTTRLNPFEATRKLLAADNQTIDNRFECFFTDYSIMPLFMFENYTKNRPVKGDNLKAISMAADAFCLSDLADKEIRSRQNWSLLQFQGLTSTVIPSKLCQSYSVTRVNFPEFLGKLSNANKRLRLVQELNAHMCLSVRGGLDADYIEAIAQRLTAPLMAEDKQAGIAKVIEFMHEYALTREDLTNIMELACWSFKADPFQNVEPKIKTLLTNTFKKQTVALPYFVDDMPAKKRKPLSLYYSDEEADPDDDEDEVPLKLKPKKIIKKEKKEKKEKVEKPEKPEKAGKKEKKEKKSEKIDKKPTEVGVGKYFGTVKKPNASVSVMHCISQ